MNTYEAVKAAKSPAAALLAIATALDRIEARIEEIDGSDDWGSDWDDEDEPATVLTLVPPAKATMTIDTAADEVVFSEPPEELKALRRTFAKDVLHLDIAGFAMDADPIEAYAVGGPLWLWVYNRDHMMQYEVPVRRMMVEDVENSGDVQGAHDLGSDILKFPSSGPMV